MHLKTKELILCALFIALITVGTFIKIPVGTDVYTLQFLFTLLAGLLLGPRLGAIAVGTYVVMGLVGIPVFASGGGPGYIAQPTFGYLLGFIVQAWVNGAWARKAKQINFRSLLEANLVGMVIVWTRMVLCSIQLYNQCTDFRVGSYLVLRYSAGYS